jgi:hypothetical protein
MSLLIGNIINNKEYCYLCQYFRAKKIVVVEYVLQKRGSRERGVERWGSS